MTFHCNSTLVLIKQMEDKSAWTVITTDPSPGPSQPSQPGRRKPVIKRRPGDTRPPRKKGELSPRVRRSKGEENSEDDEEGDSEGDEDYYIDEESESEDDEDCPAPKKLFV